MRGNESVITAREHRHSTTQECVGLQSPSIVHDTQQTPRQHTSRPQTRTAAEPDAGRSHSLLVCCPQPQQPSNDKLPYNIIGALSLLGFSPSKISVQLDELFQYYCRTLDRVEVNFTFVCRSYVSRSHGFSHTITFVNNSWTDSSCGDSTHKLLDDSNNDARHDNETSCSILY